MAEPALVALDHVQVAMPAGGEDAARAFYAGLLGLSEVAKPPVQAARGGCWFERSDIHLHLGVEADFCPALKAHPAFRVAGFDALCAQLAAAGHTPRPDSEGDARRVFVSDPFGNRIELIEAA